MKDTKLETHRPLNRKQEPVSFFIHIASGDPTFWHSRGAAISPLTRGQGAAQNLPPIGSITVGPASGAIDPILDWKA